MNNTSRDGNTTGRALVAVGNRKVEVRRIAVLPPTEWDIQVRLERSAISIGTESHVVSKIASADSPLIIGYAPVARVEAVGTQAARDFAKGARVIYFGPDRTPNGPAHCCGGH